VEPNHSTEANRHSTFQEIPRLLRNPMLITVFTRTRHSLLS